MARCISCSAELQPAWKYCIHCGQRVETVPSAIRPDAAPEPQTPRGQVTALALFGWGLGALLAVIAVVAVVLFSR